MLNIGRRRLRETITQGDSPAVVDAKVAEAAPGVDGEHQAALWLYGWHYSGGDGASRPSARVARDGDAPGG